MNALIVDDEPTVRLLLSRILKRDADCVVTEATNGVEALDLLARQRFDFIVIDVMMPIMDGIETLTAIRRTPSLKHLPVMVLSAVRDEAQVRQLVSLGVAAYLTKPLRPADASTRIQKFIASLHAGGHPGASGRTRSLRELPQQARLLVVDGDADFRHFVTSTLGHAYRIEEAEGGAQGLRSCIENRPAAVLLGRHLGAVPGTMFVRKLRSLKGLSSVPVVVSAATGDPPLDGADAVIARTFVVEAFRREWDRLTGSAGDDRQLLDARPELRAQMISATEQVFGMMLELEVVSQTEEPGVPEAGVDAARVLLSLPREDHDLEFGLLMSRETSVRVTARILNAADAAREEDVFATLQEIANIITGRLQNALHARGDDATTGLPVVARLDAPLQAEAESWTAVRFADAAGEVSFTTFLRDVPRHDAHASTAERSATRGA